MFTMLWLPSRRQRKEQAAMLAAIKPGTKVVTAAGIIGSIVSIKDGEDEIVIKSADAKLKVTKASIVRVLGAEDETK
jgi:preprotein translocase subunit YajC